MAGLRGSGLTGDTFRLPDLAVIEDAFLPAWRKADRVRGAFGWFNAGWISWFAPGVADYLARTTRPVEFTIAPELFSAEHEALSKALAGDVADVIAPIVDALDEAGLPTADALSRHAVACLAWMVANARLTLRIAIPVPGSNYHPKVWLFEDESGDSVVIRGSANATTRGIGFGVEHLDLDVSWEIGHRVDKYRKMVEDWAKGDDPVLVETRNIDADVLATAIRRHVPPAMPTVDDYERALGELTHRPGWRSKGMPMAPTFTSGLRIPEWIDWGAPPYEHQSKGVDRWEAAGRAGIEEVATGGGKTIMGLVAAKRSHETAHAPMCLVISVPGEELVHQWADEVRTFGVEPVTPTLTTGRARFDAVTGAMTRLYSAPDDHIEVFVVTFARLVESGFRSSLAMVRQMAPRTVFMLIGDEVHGLGAEGRRGQMPEREQFDYRLGLSATPVREYDSEGTRELIEYFGEVVFEFTLADAIANRTLVPYDYFLSVVGLDEDELSSYRKLSARVGKALGMRLPRKRWPRRSPADGLCWSRRQPKTARSNRSCKL